MKSYSWKNGAVVFVLAVLIMIYNFREFKSDKRAKIEEEKGKVVDLILPGWDGKWAGEDFKVIFIFLGKTHNVSFEIIFW